MTTASPVPEGVKVLSVGELVRGVKNLLEGAYPSVWVAGEVANFKRHTSGHWYFSLKDRESQLPSVMYRGVNLRVKFDLRDGQEVIARGRLSTYVPQGGYQFAVEELQPKGIGAQELALRQLKEKLFRQGYFDPARKKKLPALPRRVALITSPTGAAVRDMLTILGRRWPMVDVWVCPVRVQGEGAAEDVAAAVQLLNRVGKADVLILGRGGGSAEDLWAFNEECVAQAIFRSRIPVVSAIGHEIDLTLADLVADVRAATPSEAAERVVPEQREVTASLRSLEGQLHDLVRQRVQLLRARLDDLAGRRALRRPLERVRDEERKLDDWAERLGRGMRQRLVRLHDRLAAEAARLETLSPLNVLARGYSLTRTEAGQVVVRDPGQVRPGDRLVTNVQHGRLVSRVEECLPDQAAS